MRKSQRALDELKAKFAAGFAYQIAQAHAWRSEKDDAFEWLDRVYGQRDPGMTRMRGDLLLAALKDDPRYKAQVARMRFPE